MTTLLMELKRRLLPALDPLRTDDSEQSTQDLLREACETVDVVRRERAALDETLRARAVVAEAIREARRERSTTRDPR